MWTKIIKVSKQETELPSSNLLTTEDNNINFKNYDMIYNGSYIVAGIVDRIWRTINNWFKTDNIDLKQKLEKIDTVFIWKSLAKYGNCFLEITRFGNWDIDEVIPIITNTMKKMKWWWYLQEVWTKKIFFNEFVPLDKRKKLIKVYKNSGAGINELKFNEKEKSTGFNPNLNEVVHIKIPETDNKNYWNSLFKSVFQQILILKNIDDQVLKYFENWRIQQYLLLDPDNKISKEDIEMLSDFLSGKKWNDDAFSTFVVPASIIKLNISDDLDIEKLLSLRKEMQKAIAMRMNMPYDLLSSDNSNKASSSTAIESFNKMTVLPLQKIIIQTYKRIFKEQFSKDIGSLEFNSLEVVDKKEKTNWLKNLVQSWILTVNEARSQLEYESIEWWDKLQSSKGVNFQLHPEEIEKVQKLTNFIKQEVDEIHNK